MKPDILLIGPLLESVLDTLDSAYTVHRLYEADDPGALITKIADNTTAVVTDGGNGVKASILERLPKVKIVAVFGVGVDAVDLEYCKKNAIAVTNTPDVLSGDVADLAVALMLCVSRNIVESDNYVRAGHWATQGNMPLTTRMFGKTTGDVDYLIVAASASKSTFKMVNADVLTALGSNGYLINISRGTLIDQEALIEALEKNTIKRCITTASSERHS